MFSPHFLDPTETPEWWEQQQYLKQTLYDHEIYSRDNDDPYPGWDDMDHLTYKDFVDAGPWLQGTQFTLLILSVILYPILRPY